jgi:hypothetical protein
MAPPMKRGKAAASNQIWQSMKNIFRKASERSTFKMDISPKHSKTGNGNEKFSSPQFISQMP